MFAVVATYLLAIKGLQLAGGLLLAWVCWKMWSELRQGHGDDAAALAEAEKSGAQKTFFQAATQTQIVVADVSMSLDNVLADVAGAAKEHSTVLVIGLIISIALMGIAANFVAKLLSRFQWIAYLGLAIIVYVSAEMIYHGFFEILPLIQGA